jgi:Dockerin type I domain
MRALSEAESVPGPMRSITRAAPRAWLAARRPYLAEALEPRRLLAVSPVGPEFRVNTTVTGSQGAPVVAADADGDFVVVWQADAPGDSVALFAQRFSAGGGPLGAEFRVSTIPPRRHVVAMDADGDFVVAWSNSGQDGSSYGIYARRYSAFGEALGVEFRVNTFTADDQNRPAVAMDADGDFVVVWNSPQDGDGLGVYAQRYTAAGAPVGGEFRVNTSTSRTQFRAAVAMDAGGDFVVAWESSHSGSTGIYAQRYNASGAPVGGELHVNTSTPQNTFDCAVGMDFNGDFVVAWSGSGSGDTTGVHARRYSAAGAARGDEFRVNTNIADRQLFPKVAVDADGDFVVAWQNGATGSVYDIYAQRYSATGVALGGEFGVNTFTSGSQQPPALAVDSDGDFVVAWESSDGSGFGVYARRYDESLQTAGPVVSDVLVRNNPVSPGERLVHTTSQAAVRFSEDMSVAGGTTGANSATNRANYRLSRNGVDVSSQIIGVSFGLVAGKYQATLTLFPVLGDGDYVLTVRQTLRNLAGNILDGNFNGNPGTDCTLAFSIRQPVNVGPEFRVNTTTIRDQLRPAAAMDAPGNFVVAWQADDAASVGSGDDIFAQRYTAAGATSGGQFLVNTGITSHQRFPSAALDADGDLVVVWQSSGQDGSGYGVYARRYAAAGAARGEEFRVNATTSGNQGQPAVAMTPGGDFVVVWESGSPTNHDVIARRYNAAGEPLGGEFRVNTTLAGNQFEPAVAVDSNGGFVVAWASGTQDPDGSTGVYARRYNNDGAPVGPEFLVPSFTTETQRRPAVALDGDGDCVIAWQSYAQDGSAYGVYARRYNAAGTAQGLGFAVNPFTTSDQRAPAVAMDADGDFVITWSSYRQDGSREGVYGRRHAANGDVIVAQFPVNTTTANAQGEPAVAADADGDFVVAWQSNAPGQDGSGYGIYARCYGPNVPPVTLRIADVFVRPESPNILIDLFAAFDDSTDADAALAFTLVGNTNPALFSGTPISVSPTAGTLTLDFAPGRVGTATLTVRATDAGGLSVDQAFTVTTESPAVAAAEYVYQSGPPHRLRLTFTQDVSASLSAADVVLEQKVGVDWLPVPGAVTQPSYDVQTNTATFAFTQAGLLSNGNYRTRLQAAGVTNPGGVPMAAAGEFPFFVLAGDLNRDRAVNGTDFAILAGNFGKTGVTFAQGDLNGDGFVNGSDFAILAGNFGKAVPVPAAPVVLQPASATGRRSLKATGVRAGKQPHQDLRRRVGESSGIRAVD